MTRAQLEVALKNLFDRLPDFSLDVPHADAILQDVADRAATDGLITAEFAKSLAETSALLRDQARCSVLYVRIWHNRELTVGRTMGVSPASGQGSESVSCAGLWSLVALTTRCGSVDPATERRMNAVRAALSVWSACA